MHPSDDLSYAKTCAAVLRNNDLRVLSRTKEQFEDDLGARGYSIARYMWAALGNPSSFTIYYGQKKVDPTQDSVLSRMARKMFSL